MFAAPRIIAIDDDPTHLRGLADGLNKYGAGCLQIHFTGDAAGISPAPHVRVIFADLHLNEGGATDEHTRHFSVIGGLLESTITPNGPYIVVLWTKFADQAGALALFLKERLSGVPKPFAVVALDKMQHLDATGAVKDTNALVAAIVAIITQQPKIASLLDWEERVLGAAAEVLNAIMALAKGDDPPARVGPLLYHLAEGAVGEGHVLSDRFGAVNEALLPILSDRIAALKGGPGAGSWTSAFSDADARSALTADDAARLNRFSHIAEIAPEALTDRGAVISLPTAMDFRATFGMTQEDAAKSQFGCANYDGATCQWMAIQAQAPCDYAQQQPGPIPYLLALVMPVASRAKGTPPQAIWQCAPFYSDGVKALTANARYWFAATPEALAGARAEFRIREQLLSDLIFRVHTYNARPGVIAFFARKEKPAPTA